MKANVNVEFASEEIEGFVKRALTNGILDALGGMEPQHVQMMLGGIQTGIGMVLSQAQAAMHGRPPQPVRGSGGPFGPPNPFGSPFGPPQPYAATGAPPGPYAPPQSDNVRPIQRESAVTERCFRIEATRHLEEGWGCCGCSTYNGVQRTHCRHCGHPRCGAVITPAPAAGPAPQVPAQAVETPEGMTHVDGVGFVPTEAIVRALQEAALGGSPAKTEPPREPT